MSNSRELTPDELKIIKYQQDNSPIVRFLRTKKDLNFAVGDYLIKLNKRNEKWEAETISGVSDQPKRFLCVFEDEYGIKYIKPLTSFGTELPTVMQLTEVSDYTRYEIDPEYAEHIILSDETKFDFADKRKESKARREQITKKNKKLAVKFGTLEDADQWIKNLKPGDKVRFGYNIPSCATATPVLFDKYEEAKNDTWRNTARAKTLKVYFKHINTNYANFVSFNSEDLMTTILMDKEPFSYETV